MVESLKDYLKPTFFLDYDTEEVANFARTVCADCNTANEKSVALYYAVRDQIIYNPYDLKYSRTAMKASSVLKRQSGYCVSKTILLAALGRHQNIPCRLGFADVTNHLSSTKLREKMGTDLFVYHGYTEMYLNDKWVKATPAFNLSLCSRFNVRPLEFDGIEDSIFHECNTLGQKHMEYVRDHGHFADLPFEQIFTAYAKIYPKFFENNEGAKTHDFAAEVAREI
ncbi:MAG: transglutaminase family protein [Desulfobulbaceae bacterium]|nr:transglutaminase family protein [Desulfobulbaceae bacterium]